MIHPNDHKNVQSSGFAEVNGIQLYYEIHGSGQPLVLIHGGGSTIMTSFERIIPQLSSDFQLIAVELQAHGHSGDRNTELSFEQDADDVAALLKILRIEKAHFFGFSNGATTSLQIAIRHPHLVDKVVAASGLLKRIGAPSQFWDFMRQATIEHMPQQYKDAFLKINPDADRLQIMHDKCAKRMLDFQDISDKDIQSIKAPVLLVNGEMDVASKAHMEDMVQLIPNAKLIILPGGHGEYMGEITCLKDANESEFPIVPILKEFLK